MDPISGVMTVGSQLNYEDIPSYTLNITVKDAYGDISNYPTMRSNTTTITIKINDLNDNAPVFGSSLYTANFDEGLVRAANVKLVTATDNDSIATNIQVSSTA